MTTTAPCHPIQHATAQHINTDEELEARCVKEFQRSSYRAIRDLNVTATTHGHVTITGVVPDYYNLQVAQEVIRKVRGVARIFNQAKVILLKPS